MILFGRPCNERMILSVGVVLVNLVTLMTVNQDIKRVGTLLPVDFTVVVVVTGYWNAAGLIASVDCLVEGPHICNHVMHGL